MSSTVFVIGAGASVDFGFPTGPQLNQSIAAAVTLTQNDWNELRWVDDHIHHDFTNWPAISPKVMMNASKIIGEGISYHQSPDDFLYAFGEDEAVVVAGKAGIVASILRAERSSWLASLDQHDRGKADAELRLKVSGWPLQLIKLLAPGVRASEPERLFQDISFINFNYDRCLEQILYHALQRSHRLSEQVAADVVSQIKIIHPYGWIGRLPWLAGEERPVNFGGDYYDRLPELVQNVHTLTEGHNTADERQELRSLMTAASKVVFLGFGFHTQNMDLIACDTRPNTPNPTVFATAFHVSPLQRRVFQDRMNSCLKLGGHVQPILGDYQLTCDSFMDESGIALVG